MTLLKNIETLGKGWFLVLAVVGVTIHAATTGAELRYTKGAVVVLQARLVRIEEGITLLRSSRAVQEALNVRIERHLTRLEEEER